MRLLLSLTFLFYLISLVPAGHAQMANWVDLKDMTQKHIQAGKWEPSDKAFQKALDAAIKASTTDADLKGKLYSPVWAEYKNKGIALNKEKDFKGAEKAFVRAVKIAEKFGNGDPRLVVSLFDLYQVYLDQYDQSWALETEKRLMESYDLMIPVQVAAVKKAVDDLKGSLPEKKSDELAKTVKDLKVLSKTVDAEINLSQFDDAARLINRHVAQVKGSKNIEKPIRTKVLDVYGAMARLVDDYKLKSSIGKELTGEDAEREEELEDSSASNYEVFAGLGWLLDKL